MMRDQQMLRAAILARLRTDSALTAILPGEAIRDGAQRYDGSPVMQLGQISSRPLDGSFDSAYRHEFDLLAYDKDIHRAVILNYLHLARAALISTPLPLAGFHLIALDVTGVQSRQVEGGRLWQGQLSFRAITEQDTAG